MNDLKWESSVPRAQGQVYHLRGGPQPPDLVPPPTTKKNKIRDGQFGL